MDDLAADPATAPPPSVSAGEKLRRAREARGLTLDEVAARTRVPLRHLQAIETSDYLHLPSPTYAVGFAKAYARAVGADEVAVAADVRGEVAQLGRRLPEYQPYEVADPARVPSRAIAIVGIAVAIAVVVLAALWLGSGWMGAGPSGRADAPAPVTPAASAPVPAAAPAAPAGGQVTLTATDEVWLRVYDADNKTLYLGTMKPGERFDVPAGANAPKINVGRPDKLQVTLNGSAVPPLGSGARPIKDVAVDATSIGARLSGEGAASTAAAPAGATAATPTGRPSQPVAGQERHRPRRPLTETQRANLASAAAARSGRTP